MHCASLGEFEQGRPLLESIRKNYPHYRLLLTFFSPSGYEVQKNYAGADWVFYLPMDGPRNARRFLEIVQPSLVIFVKYEFWYYYLKKIKYRNIPLLLVSALFRKDMDFFKWYGAMMRKMLSRFDHLFVQTAESKRLLDEIGMAGICTISGDTRFDRVIAIASAAGSIPAMEHFASGQRLIIAGSTWQEDEVLLKESLPFLQEQQLKLVIAPHVVDTPHLEELRVLFPDAIFFSACEKMTGPSAFSVMIIDNVGMLSRLYQYGWCNYVGGGLTRSGVHNVLEAAVYGKPVFYGANHEKYAEAVGLVKGGGAISLSGRKNWEAALQHLLTDKEFYDHTARHAAEFVTRHAGATSVIMQYIQEKRLLTN